MGSKKNLLQAGNAQIEGRRVFLIFIIVSLYSLSGLLKRVSTIFTLAQLFFKSSSLNMLVLFSKKLGRGY